MGEAPFNRTSAWGYSLPHLTSNVIDNVFLIYVGMLYISSYNYSPEDYGRLCSFFMKMVTLTQLFMSIAMQIYQLYSPTKDNKVGSSIKKFKGAAVTFKNAAEKFKKSIVRLTNDVIENNKQAVYRTIVITISNSVKEIKTVNIKASILKINVQLASMLVLVIRSYNISCEGLRCSTIWADCLKYLMETLRVVAKGDLLEVVRRVRQTARNLAIGDYSKFLTAVCPTLKKRSKRLKIKALSFKDKTIAFKNEASSANFRSTVGMLKELVNELKALGDDFYMASFETCSCEFQSQAKEFKQACEEFQKSAEEFHVETDSITSRYKAELGKVKDKFENIGKEFEEVASAFDTAVDNLLKEISIEPLLVEANDAVIQYENALKTIEKASFKAFEAVDEVAGAEAICGVGSETAKQICEKIKAVCQDLCGKLGNLCKCIKASLDSACTKICGQVGTYCTEIQTCVNGLSDTVCTKLDELCKCTKHCIQTACTTICGNIGTGATHIGTCLKEVCKGICKSFDALGTIFDAIGKQFKCNEPNAVAAAGSGAGTTTCSTCNGISVTVSTTCTIPDTNCTSCSAPGATGQNSCSGSTSTNSCQTTGSENCTDCTNGNSGGTHDAKCPAHTNHTADKCEICKEIKEDDVKRTIQTSAKEYSCVVIDNAFEYALSAANSLVHAGERVCQVATKVDKVKCEFNELGTKLEDVCKKFEESFKELGNDSDGKSDSLAQIELNVCKFIHLLDISIHAVSFFLMILVPLLSKPEDGNVSSVVKLLRRASIRSSSGLNAKENLRAGRLNSLNKEQMSDIISLKGGMNEDRPPPMKPTKLLYLLFALHGYGYGSYEYLDALLPTFIAKNSVLYTAVGGQLRGFTKVASTIVIGGIRKALGQRLGDPALFLIVSALIAILVVPLGIAFFIMTKPVDPNPSDSEETDIDVMNIISFAVNDGIIVCIYMLNAPMLQYASTHLVPNDPDYKIFAPTVFLIFCYIGTQVFVKLLLPMDRSIVQYICIVAFSCLYFILTVPKEGVYVAKFVHYLAIALYGCIEYAFFINANVLVTAMLNNKKHIKWRWILQEIILMSRNMTCSIFARHFYGALESDKDLIGIPDSYSQLKGVRFFLFFIFGAQTLALFIAGFMRT